jgi:hypothetical protein
MRLTQQRIDVELGAEIFDGNLKPIGTVSGRGMATGGTWGDQINTTVSTALQLALSNLLQEIRATYGKL